MMDLFEQECIIKMKFHDYIQERVKYGEEKFNSIFQKFVIFTDEKMIINEDCDAPPIVLLFTTKTERYCWEIHGMLTYYSLYVLGRNNKRIKFTTKQLPILNKWVDKIKCWDNATYSWIKGFQQVKES